MRMYFKNCNKYVTDDENSGLKERSEVNTVLSSQINCNANMIRKLSTKTFYTYFSIQVNGITFL